MNCVNDTKEQSIKFLGVHLDPFLTFKHHISILNSKLSTGLYFIRSVRNILNEKSLKYLYYALIHSHLIYAIHVYSCVPDSSLNGLLKKQKNAIRVISNNKYNAHTEPIFKNLRILPFFYLVKFFKLQFMHDFKQNFLPSSFEGTWITNRIRREGQAEIELRNDDQLYVPLARSTFVSRLPLFDFPTTWDKFPAGNIKFL